MVIKKKILLDWFKKEKVVKMFSDSPWSWYIVNSEDITAGVKKKLKTQYTAKCILSHKLF